ncbi:hypothetical protein ACT691_06655 [Vibrio metschnikovii]
MKTPEIRFLEQYWRRHSQRSIGGAKGDHSSYQGPAMAKEAGRIGAWPWLAYFVGSSLPILVMFQRHCDWATPYQS